MYSEDYDETFPILYPEPYAYAQVWSFHVKPYIAGKRGSTVTDDVFKCPNVRGYQDNTAYVAYGILRYTIAGSPPYAATDEMQRPATHADIAEPSRQMLIAESNYQHASDPPLTYRGWYELAYGRLAGRHYLNGPDERVDGSANITFVDGHVKFLSVARLNRWPYPDYYVNEPWNYRKRNQADVYPF